MFFGEYHYQLDEKSRLRIPSKLKSESKEYVITKGTNNCLFVFNKSYFENEFLSKLASVPTFSVSGQKPIRALLSSSFEVCEDSQGRFLLPSTLKDFANISKNIVFIGVGNRIEIWAEETWNDYNNEDGKTFDNIIESLSGFNI